MRQLFEFLTILQVVRGLLLLLPRRALAFFLRLFAVIVELVELRKARGWTQEQAAEVVGVEPRTWQRWEGGVAPRADAMRRLADILETSYEDLMAYQWNGPIFDRTSGRLITAVLCSSHIFTSSDIFRAVTKVRTQSADSAFLLLLPRALLPSEGVMYYRTIKAQ